MSTSSTNRVTATFDTVEDATAWLTVEDGGFFDVSVSGSWAGVVTLERRTTSGSTVITVETYTANTERVGQFAGESQIRLRFSTDASGDGAFELRVGKGKSR